MKNNTEETEAPAISKLIKINMVEISRRWDLTAYVLPSLSEGLGG